MAEIVAFDEARALVVALHKRRGLLLTCGAVGLLLPALYNYSTRPQYEAQAQLLIDWRAVNVLPQESSLETRPGGPDYLQTHFELLRGRELAETVIKSVGPRLRTDLSTGAMVSPWARLRRTEPGPDAAGGEGVEVPSNLLAAFRSRLTVVPVPSTRLVYLRFRSFDPALAAETANALADSYVASSLEYRSATSSAASMWLEARLKEQQTRVTEAETAVQRYREREGLVNLDERRGTVEQKLAAVTAAAVNARTERVAKETAYARMRALGPAELLSLPSVKASPVVESLRARLVELRDQETRLSATLGDRHPDLLTVRERIARTQEQIEAEVAEIVKAVEVDYRTTVETETNLSSSLEDVKREALALGRKALECDALERAAESHRKLLQELMARAKEIGLESELKTTELRVVERARLSHGPVAPRRTRNHLLGLLAGLGLGIGLALLFERLDNTLKTPEDVKVHLRVPFLGIIPAMRDTGTTGNSAAQVSRIVDPASAAAEAYRVLRTNLLFSSPDVAVRVYLFTSASPGEGKTTSVANLAVALAQNGARVLAVDADLRRPALHAHFGLDKTQGLSDLVIGGCPFTEAVQHTQVRGLQILPSGYVPPNPAELLGSPSMKELVAVLRKRFDWVLFDAPPLLTMADALVLCSLVDGTVLVARADVTPLPAIHRAIDHITGVGGKLTGLLLNRADLERHSYYYSQHYGDYYRTYYGGAERAAEGPRSAGGR
jgi:succinoglycan biosynthesis transport protein ExoP